MAKLFEYQGKKLLGEASIPVPEGDVAKSPEQAGEITGKLGRSVAVKGQTWTTGRAGAGGIMFADSPREAEDAARHILGMDLKGFKIHEILVEEKLAIKHEFYLGMTMNDACRSPVIVFSTIGGTGVEEAAVKHPDKVVRSHVDVLDGLAPHRARNLLVGVGIRGMLQNQLTGFLVNFFQFCRQAEVRSAEINPLILTDDDRLLAADCHLVVDDYAVFRHPEMGIEIAREYDRPPSELEKIAYNVEAKDHRGTFYFFEMEKKPGQSYVGFHGAGGGGSMMSMDALLSEGLQIANFCDTSGNPSASKVYRAAKIILAQKGVCAYFASGSGVASQEQFHSARGLVKAFREIRLNMPAVIRIGGNSEETAMDILRRFTEDLPCQLEAYGRDTSANTCAKRLKELVSEWDSTGDTNIASILSDSFSDGYSFDTLTGRICIEHKLCSECPNKPCVDSCKFGVLRFEEDCPVLAISKEEAAKGRCTECLACELACEFYGRKAMRIDLPIPDLDRIIPGE